MRKSSRSWHTFCPPPALTIRKTLDIFWGRKNNFPFLLQHTKRPHDRKAGFLSCGLEKERERSFTPPDFFLAESFQRSSTASFFHSFPCASISCNDFNASWVNYIIISFLGNPFLVIFLESFFVLREAKIKNAP